MADIHYNITGDASQLAAELSNAQSAASALSKDIDAINTGMDGMLDRAQKISKFFKDNVELLNEMKQILTLVGSINEANQSAMNSNLQAIRELSTQVIRQGGTIQDVTRLAGMASSTNVASNFAPNMADVAAKQAATYNMHAETRAGNHSSTEFGGGSSLADTLIRSANRAGTEPHFEEGFKGNWTGGLGGGGSGGRGGGRGSRRGGGGGSRRGGGGGGGGEEVDPTFARPQTLKNLIDNFRSIDRRYGFNEENPERAAIHAYDQGTRYIDKILGTKGIGGSLGTIVKKNMFGARDDVVRATRDVMRLPDSEHAFARAYAGKDETGSSLKAGTPEHTLNQTLTRLNNMLERADNWSGKSLLGGKIPGMGTFGEAAGTIGIGSVLLPQIASMARVGTGYVQQQAQGYGATDYGRSAGNFIDTAMRSWGGLNPLYSFGNAQQAQNYGINLGYRGGGAGGLLGQYENAAQTLQTHYGMSQQQTAQAIGQMQQVGMTPAQTAAMLMSVRNTANAGGQYYNTGAAVQASLNAQGGFMGWGGSTAASGEAGKIAGKFAGGPLVSGILAGTGLNGQELMNSQFGMGLMAQKLGISYNQMYATREKMMSTASGADKYIGMFTKDILGQLSNSVGTDLTKVKQMHDLDKYAMVLMSVLQGYGINFTNGPQEAVAYVWSLIQQAKGSFNSPQGKPVASGTPMYNGQPVSATNLPGRGDYYVTGNSYSSSGGSSGSGSTVPSPSSSAPSSQTSTQAYTSYANFAAANQGAASGGQSNSTLEVRLKGKHAEALLDLSLSHHNNTTNGNTAPSVRISRAVR